MIRHHAVQLAKYDAVRYMVECSLSVEATCGGAIPHNKYISSTLVGLTHPEIALQAAFRTGTIFEACGDLLQTGDAYSADEKHRACRAVVRIVLASVPQLG